MLSKSNELEDELLLIDEEDEDEIGIEIEELILEELLEELLDELLDEKSDPELSTEDGIKLETVLLCIVELEEVLEEVSGDIDEM